MTPDVPVPRPGVPPGSGSATDLLAAFERIADTLGGAHAAWRTLGRSLLDAYDEPARHYHSRAHLVAVLRVSGALLDAEGAAASVGVPVALAAWFHDAIYDPLRSDNEARSATWAEDALGDLGAGERTIEAVVLHVLATATHMASDVPGAACFLDADLAVLGAPWPTYVSYAGQIRREYGHLDDEAFRTGRADVLRSFLARPVLYHSASGRERFEAAARANLGLELHAREACSGLHAEQ